MTYHIYISYFNGRGKREKEEAERKKREEEEVEECRRGEAF